MMRIARHTPLALLVALAACDPSAATGAVGVPKAKAAPATPRAAPVTPPPPPQAAQPGQTVVPGGGEVEFKPIWNPPRGDGSLVLPQDDASFRPIWNPPGGNGERPPVP